MGTIAERTTADGKTRYRAQIRITRKGLPPFIKTRTFAKVGSEAGTKKTTSAIFR